MHQTNHQIVEYNPFQPDHNLEPHSIFAELRARAPVSYSAVLQHWLILRHDAICRVLDDPGTFSSRITLPSLADNPPEVRDVLARCTPDDDNLVCTDPPRHGRLRALAAPIYSRERLDAMARHVWAACERWLDAHAAKGRAELVGDFIVPLILGAGGALMGIDPDDQPSVPRWLGAWQVLWDPTMPLEAKLPAARTMVEFDEYVVRLAAERRRAPRDDAMSILVHGQGPDLAPLTTTEIVNIFKPMIQAAIDVAASTIANGLYVTLREPGLAATLRSRPELVPQAYHEAMRLEGPVKAFRRLAVRDVSFGDIRIPADSPLFVCIQAANRDAAVFSSPHVFDMHRPELSGKNLAYGMGIHACLGGALGHLQGTVVVKTLLGRLPRLRLGPDFRPDYVPSPVFRQLRRLDVAWD